MRIIHQTGERDYNDVLKTYQEQGAQAEVHAFIDDMPGAVAQADLLISRAGATAVAELAAAGRASILIPFPGATDQHQLENARAMERAGAARVIVQSELTPERLKKEIRDLAASQGRWKAWKPPPATWPARRRIPHRGHGGEFRTQGLASWNWKLETGKWRVAHTLVCMYAAQAGVADINYNVSTTQSFE